MVVVGKVSCYSLWLFGGFDVEFFLGLLYGFFGSSLHGSGEACVVVVP